MIVKKVCLFCLLLASVRASAQLKELPMPRDWQLLGQVKYVGAAKATLEFMPGNPDTTYLLLMRDYRYELKNYFSIRFNGSGGTLENFYTILLSFFQKENRKNKNYVKLFSLGNVKVHVQHYRQLTAHQVMLTTDDGTILLGEGEIKRLFGRK